MINYTSESLLKSRIFRISVIVLFAFSLFPFLYIIQFNIPLSDEFITMHYRSYLGHIGYQKLLLSAWSGRYTANLMESLYPISIQLWFYRLVPMLSLSFLFIGIYAVVRQLFYENSLLIALILLVILLNYIPSPGDLIYYTPAIIIYTISFLILLSIIAISLSPIPLKYRIPVLILQEVLLMGTSEAYIPLVLLFSTTFALDSHIKNKPFKKAAWFNLFLICCIFIMLVSFSGNQKRLEAQMIHGIIPGIYNYIHTFIRWTIRFIPALPLLIYLILIVRNGANSPSPPPEIPWKPVILAIAGYFALFTPFIFINLSDYKRLGNVFFFYFLGLSVLLIQKLPRQFDLLIKTPKIIILLFIVFFISSGNIKRAYQDIQNGYSMTYSQMVWERFQYLEEHRGSKKAVIPDIPRMNYILSIQDVNDRPDSLITGLFNPLQLYFKIDTITTE